MILIKFNSRKNLNNFLGKNKYPVKKVKLLTEGNLFKLKTVYYVLIDQSNNYQ